MPAANMKDSIRQRLEKSAERFEEVGQLMADPGIDGGSREFRELSMEYARLTPLAGRFAQYRAIERELAAAQAMQQDPDPDMRALGEEECPRLSAALEAAELELRRMLVPRDPRDDQNIFLEIRAGTGGDEAAIFAGDLLRMYSRYAETRGWQVETISESHGEHGGYKEVISRIAGPGVFARLKFESGTHRVQRVPATEAQGRIHTSAVTVAVLPEAEEVDVEINANDLRIDVYRSGGPGGQSVNTTDSAVRVTHLPTGLVVICQDEKSQLKNKNKALKVLRARLLDAKIQEQDQQRSDERKSQVGTGDRSGRIRTYNFPQSRVTDHRIGLTLYRLEAILQGDIQELIDGLTTHYQTQALQNVEPAASR